MSWIETNFLWMRHRCGWASKPDQETVLAVWLRREAYRLDLLRTPRETVLWPAEESTAQRLGLSRPA